MAHGAVFEGYFWLGVEALSRVRGV